MCEIVPVSDQCIIDCLENEYTIKVTKLTLLPIGADINACVYKAETEEQSYFVKLKRNYRNRTGIVLQVMLHHAGVAQIITPLKTKHGQITKDIDDWTLIVYPFIESCDGFSKELTDIQWIAFGESLRKIHTFAIPEAIKKHIRNESYSSQWREAVRSMYAYIDKPIADDEVALKLSLFMKEHRSIIQRLVDRAEQLAQRIREQSPPELVLCHSDIHGGNVLIAENDNLYIIDWDDPIMAPKERDLMFIGGGINHVWNNPRDEKLFYQGYGKVDVNRTILAYYRYERIVEDIAVYAQQLLFTISGGKDRLEMYNQFIRMFDPRDVIDIAFQTDADL